jgi:hypothetical protein
MARSGRHRNPVRPGRAQPAAIVPRACCRLRTGQRQTPRRLRCWSDSGRCRPHAQSRRSGSAPRPTARWCDMPRKRSGGPVGEASQLPRPSRRRHETSAGFAIGRRRHGNWRRCRRRTSRRTGSLRTPRPRCVHTPPGLPTQVPATGSSWPRTTGRGWLQPPNPRQGDSEPVRRATAPHCRTSRFGSSLARRRRGPLGCSFQQSRHRWMRC